MTRRRGTAGPLSGRGARGIALSAAVLLAASGGPGCSRASTGAADAAVRENACPELAARLCDAVGRDTPTCGELISTVQLLPDAACAAGLRDVGTSIARLEAREGQCRDLVERLCRDLGADSVACHRVRADAAGLPTSRCEMMNAHYEATLASIREQDAASRPLDAETQAALVAGSPPALGPADAKVTLVQFVDFECPFCARAAPVVARLRATYGDRLRIVVRQFPLDFHRGAHLAAQAALAAHAQGRFWQLEERLYASQPRLDRAAIERAAADGGLDVAALRTALDTGRYAAAVDADLALGARARVDGTPTLFVNGARVEDAADYDAIARLVDASLGS